MSGQPNQQSGIETTTAIPASNSSGKPPLKATPQPAAPANDLTQFNEGLANNNPSIPQVQSTNDLFNTQAFGRSPRGPQFERAKAQARQEANANLQQLTKG